MPTLQASLAFFTVALLAAIESLLSAVVADSMSGDRHNSNVELIAQLGFRLDGARCVLTDSHQRMGLTGLYAAGDVVAALDQISVAMGHAAVAATTIHNDLRERDGHTPD